MSHATPAASPDFVAVKKRQQATWASGDFSVVAARIVYAAEQLCEHADLQAGWRVLDVATGSGNAALAAARRNCQAVGVDYVPALLERGRLRAQVEHLEVEFVEGDAENLPFPDASFDAVVSVYGSMFAPNHQATADEMVRVCRPGGIIALACWTPEGFIGETFRLMSSWFPPAPGLIPPVKWGDEEYLKSLFGPSIQSINCQKRSAIFRFRSAEENVDFFRQYYGPTLKSFAALAPADQEKLHLQLANLAREYDRNQGRHDSIAIRADYLETIIVRR